ncbi:MAG: chloride channel protein, partial [Kiritimatiellae bacterium]|nr:chloride channel protein [Kiritimatiellia bacterium]
LVPVIFAATTLTHLFGGSAGREGAALQIGGGLGCRIGEMLHMDDRDERTITLCGMAALFAALFGTPITATVFVLEVASVGFLQYAALWARRSIWLWTGQRRSAGITAGCSICCRLPAC